jgi:plastocyanin domain-containing protein
LSLYLFLYVHNILKCSKEGYSPAALHLPAHRPVTLIWVTKGDVCCAQSVVIPRLNYQAVLPATGRTPLDIPAQKKNTVLNYSCSMGCRVGKLVFDSN